MTASTGDALMTVTPIYARHVTNHSEGGTPISIINIPLFKEMLRYGLRGHFDTLFQAVLLRIDYLFIGAIIQKDICIHDYYAKWVVQLVCYPCS